MRQSTQPNPVDKISTFDKIEEQNCYFVTSTLKLIVMSLCTFGWYEVYWFFKNWILIRQRGRKCYPIGRAILTPFFCYSCFHEIQKSARSCNLKLKFPIVIIAISYFVSSTLFLLPDLYSYLSYLSPLPLIQVNRVARAVNKCRSPNFINNKFTKWDWLTVILGSGLTFTVIISNSIK